MAPQAKSGFDYRYCDPNHSPTDPTDMDAFARRLRNAGVLSPGRQNVAADGKKLYVWATGVGVGIPAEAYDGLDVRLIESIGMSHVGRDHRLYKPDEDHVLIFEVRDEGGD